MRYEGSQKMWKLLEKRPNARGLFKCTECNTEREAFRWQAKAGRLRCWTCNPDTKLSTLVGEALRPKNHKPKPGEQSIDGRVPMAKLAYSRLVRFSVAPPTETEPDAPTQQGRIEIVGLRTKNPLNRRLHWTAVSAAATTAKKGTLSALYMVLGEPPPDGHDFAYEVRISRLSTKGMQDDEGVVASLKGVRDAFAIFVRINDGNRRRLRITYGMGKARVQAVVIEWTRTTGPFEDDGLEELVFFDEAEVQTVRDEHRETRRYWKERRARLLERRGADEKDIARAIGSLEEGSEEGDE